jgi:hypothetical protein
MRLQLIIVIAAIAGAAPARAQIAETEPGDGKVDATVGVYADDDETTVVTSLVDANLRLPVPVMLSAHALVDAVSSASVDVVSAATTRWDERRIELGATAVARAADTDATIGYTTSGENDCVRRDDAAVDRAGTPTLTGSAWKTPSASAARTVASGSTSTSIRTPPGCWSRTAPCAAGPGP